MHETDDDLRDLQELIDSSFASAGPHLLSICRPERRLDAESVCGLLVGVQIAALATVSADGAPISGPVDTVFVQGRFVLGTAPEAVRARHMQVRPRVSLTHARGEGVCVVVHGEAVPIDLNDARHAAVRAALVEVYAPRYGDDWIEWAATNFYVRVEPRRMFTFRGVAGDPQSLPEGAGQA